MYPWSDGLRFNVYVESRARWHFDSRLYSSRVIVVNLAHNIISRTFDSRFVFYIIIVSSHKRLDDLITSLLLQDECVYCCLFAGYEPK